MVLYTRDFFFLNFFAYISKCGNCLLLKFLFSFQALLVGIGLQHKTIEDLEKDLGLAVSQLLGLYNRILRKVVNVSLSSLLI